VQRELEEYIEKLMAPAKRATSESAEGEEGGAATGAELSERLLEILLFSSRAARVLQIGIGCGRETVRMAQVSPAVQIIALEDDAERVQAARVLIDRAELTERVEIAGFDGLNGLAQGEIRFDALLLGTDPRSARRYLDFLLPVVEVGGLIVIRNMLLGGRITEVDPDTDEQSVRAQDALNGYFLIHPQLRATILPIGDGVGIATKTQPLMMELGGPF